MAIAAPLHAFNARYKTECGHCQLLILPGQPTARFGVVYAHADCRDPDVRDESERWTYDYWLATAKPSAEESGLDLSPLPEGDGYYAVPNETGKLTFLKIDRVADGRWAGWTFVRQYLGGQGPAQKLGAQRPGQTYSGQWAVLLAKVLADPMGAAAAFGRELGICGRCARELTDVESRRLGVGPICRKAWGL